jgi:hypothetical protein
MNEATMNEATMNEATINAKYYSIKVIEGISDKRNDIEKELRALYRLKIPNFGQRVITDKLKGSTLFICTTTNDNAFSGGAVVKIIEDKCWILLIASTKKKCGIGETLILNICRHYERDIYVESDPKAKNFYAKFQFIDQLEDNIMMRPSILSVEDGIPIYWRKKTKYRPRKFYLHNNIHIKRQDRKQRREKESADVLTPIQHPQSIKAFKRREKKDKIFNKLI